MKVLLISMISFFAASAAHAEQVTFSAHLALPRCTYGVDPSSCEVSAIPISNVVVDLNKCEERDSNQDGTFQWCTGDLNLTESRDGVRVDARINVVHWTYTTKDNQSMSSYDLNAEFGAPGLNPVSFSISLGREGKVPNWLTVRGNQVFTNEYVYTPTLTLSPEWPIGPGPKGN